MDPDLVHSPPMSEDLSDKEIIGLCDSPGSSDGPHSSAADNPELYFKKSFREDPWSDITIPPKPSLPDSEASWLV